MITLIDRFRPIRTFLFDIDGVLTDGYFTGSETGHMLRSMNIKDCYAMQLALKAGYKVGILSAATQEAVRLQLAHFDVDEVHLNLADKADHLQKLSLKLNFSCDTALYMGDDLPDIGIMKICGLAACPNDAVMEVQAAADYISPHNGGRGCVRDVIEKVMKLNGHWYEESAPL